MAADDKETMDEPSPREQGVKSGRAGTPGESPEASAPAKRLPPRVERALAKARAAAKADHERKSGRWLAVIPAGIAIVTLLLLMPRATVPDSIPIPRADQRVLARAARDDDARARAAEETRLPTGILNVGTAFRAVNAAEARDADEIELADARRTLEAALRDLQPRAGLEEDLLSLRALQARRFLDAVAVWEATGETNTELTELGGNFVRRSVDAGWVTGRRILLSEAQRRVAFKTVWNALVGVDTQPAFALTLDEQRELYALYIARPHPPDGRRQLLAAQRRDAKTPEACLRATAEERRATELWRADKIRKLAQIDPSYPGAYSLGVAYYHAGRYDLSAEAFTAFIGAHPDGPYTLRAKNHLKAALAAGAL